LADVYVRYRGKPPILQAITIEVPPGVYLIVGHGKAGKSTLLRSVGGVIPRLMGEIAGEVTVQGITLEPLTLSECLSLATYVEADPATAILGLTVGQELALLAPTKEEVERLLRIMGLEHLADREVTRLSGGEQVRLVLAGVLATRAPVILLDEPLSQLDTYGRRDFVAALRAFVDEDRSRTVFLADYRSEHVADVIDGILEVRDGGVRWYPVAALKDQAMVERWGLFQNEPGLTRNRYCLGSIVASVRDVHVTLDDVSILHGVSLDVHAGECILVCGPNGGGKTTLMLALAGAIQLSAGTVDRRGPVGYVFQDVRLQAVTATVGSEIELAPRLQGWTEDAIRSSSAEWLAWHGVDARTAMIDLHEQDLRFVSAAAMASTASVLVLDEPTVGIDMSGVFRVLALIELCRSRGTAVIVISHDEIFSSVASRRITVRDGRVTEDVSL
jgi:energy-coupling factor transport system ATP-binding protein